MKNIMKSSKAEEVNYWMYNDSLISPGDDKVIKIKHITQALTFFILWGF
jgi:hypothetical protein